MTYSNETYNLYQYEFEDINNPESIKLVKSASYTFNPPINLDTIVEVMKSAKFVKEPQIPFPQANDFRKIVSLCESLNKSEKDEGYEPLTKIGVAIKFGFHMRQSDYYINAARYLGLVELTNENTVILTALGKKVFSMQSDNKNKELVSLILEHRVFNECLKLYFMNNGKLNKAQVVKVMKQCSLYNIDSEDTYIRRASSIIGWIKWIILLTDENR